MCSNYKHSPCLQKVLYTIKRNLAWQNKLLTTVTSSHKSPFIYSDPELMEFCRKLHHNYACKSLPIKCLHIVTIWCSPRRPEVINWSAQAHWSEICQVNLHDEGSSDNEKLFSPLYGKSIEQTCDLPEKVKYDVFNQVWASIHILSPQNTHI